MVLQYSELHLSARLLHQPLTGLPVSALVLLQSLSHIAASLLIKMQIKLCHVLH